MKPKLCVKYTKFHVKHSYWNSLNVCLFCEFGEAGGRKWYILIIILRYCPQFWYKWWSSPKAKLNGNTILCHCTGSRFSGRMCSQFPITLSPYCPFFLHTHEEIKKYFLEKPLGNFIPGGIFLPTILKMDCCRLQVLIYSLWKIYIIPVFY